jgi:hypothetical protein
LAQPFLLTEFQPEASELESLGKVLQEQMGVTEGIEDLTDHRELVQSRWDQVKAFHPSGTPTKLSPGARKVRQDFYEPEHGKLNEQHSRHFQKKFKGMLQLVSNASEGLHNVHSELCACAEFLTVYIFLF